MDKLEKIIDGLRTKVVTYFGQDNSGHSTDHLERTLRLALYLQEKEGGDRLVIGISAFIHDVHRIMQSKANKYVSPLESLPVVEEFLKDIKITKEQKRHILHVIEHHEEYNFSSKGNVNDIESLIVQDADNLDAIGAIGLVRVLKFGIVNNRVEYDPNIPLEQTDFVEGLGDPSTLHHIHNKISRLGDYMNTKTAAKLAKKRGKIINDFVKMYLNEYNGIFE
jgi:uncharacterized protein